MPVVPLPDVVPEGDEVLLPVPRSTVFPPGRPVRSALPALPEPVVPLMSLVPVVPLVPEASVGPETLPEPILLPVPLDVP